MPAGMRTGGADGVVSTAEVPAAQRVEYWVDMVCRHLIAVESDPCDGGADFHGALTPRTVGDVQISQLVSGAQRVVRTPALLAAADADHFLLNVQRTGRSSLRQDGRVAELAVGDLVLYSSSRRYEMAFDGDFSQTVVVVPAAPLRALCPGIDKVTATAFDGREPLARLVASIAEHHSHTPFDSMPAQVAEHAGNTLLSAVTACMTARASPDAAQRRGLARFHLARIREYALTRLADQTLCVAQVGAALSLSSAHIHRLFAQEQLTFSVWLWECRLQASRTALRQPEFSHLLIGQIAERFGFSHAAHFSRAYRTRFGMTPREWRGGGAR